MAQIKSRRASSKGVEILSMLGNAVTMTYGQLFSLFTTRYDFVGQIDDWRPAGQYAIHIWLQNKTELTVKYDPQRDEFGNREEIAKAISSLGKWHPCPECGQKLCRIDADSKAHKIYLWCKHCKKEVEVNI